MWCEHLIVADADYVGRVAERLASDFQNMLNRPVGKADLARWIDCVALDGGLRPGKQQTQVVLVHDKHTRGMEPFRPSAFEEIDGQAFSDSLGEFLLSAVAVEDMVKKDDLMAEMVELALEREEVKRIVVVADCGERLHCAIDKSEASVQRVTLLTMQLLADDSFHQELLGYSVMQALGIRGEELAK